MLEEKFNYTKNIHNICVTNQEEDLQNRLKFYQNSLLEVDALDYDINLMEYYREELTEELIQELSDELQPNQEQTQEQNREQDEKLNSIINTINNNEIEMKYSKSNGNNKICIHLDCTPFDLSIETLVNTDTNKEIIQIRKDKMTYYCIFNNNNLEQDTRLDIQYDGISIINTKIDKRSNGLIEALVMNLNLNRILMSDKINEYQIEDLIKVIITTILLTNNAIKVTNDILLMTDMIRRSNLDSKSMLLELQINPYLKDTLLGIMKESLYVKTL